MIATDSPERNQIEEKKRDIRYVKEDKSTDKGTEPKRPETPHHTNKGVKKPESRRALFQNDGTSNEEDSNQGDKKSLPKKAVGKGKKIPKEKEKTAKDGVKTVKEKEKTAKEKEKTEKEKRSFTQEGKSQREEMKLSEGDYSLVNTGMKFYFVGKLISDIQKDNYQVSYLRKAAKHPGKFVLPNVPDLPSVNRENIEIAVPKPSFKPAIVAA